MADTPRRLVAGNWKMNGVGEALKEARALAVELRAHPVSCRVALFPPAPLIHRMSELLAGGPVEVGAQDAHAARSGAYTGDVSAEMLHDAGAVLVILGHSERRAVHRESNRRIAAKVEAALRAGLEPIVCVGETLAERKGGEAAAVVRRQLVGSLPRTLNGRDFAVAYEPVWAIGTGLTPTEAEIEEMHAEIRRTLLSRFPKNGAAAPILYGGSVKASNAATILKIPRVDGALVGGASLTVAEFLPIVRAA